MGETCRKRGFRRRWADLLRQLRVAYADGDVGSIRSLWYKAVAEPGLGVWLRLSNRLYPLQSLLDISHELDRRMAEHGLARASRWLLDEGVGHWLSEVPPATRAVLSSEPVILYGNHPTLLTPFLVSAHVDRVDYRIVAASFLEKFLPAFGHYAISVELPLNHWWKQLWQGGLQRLIVAYWVTRLRPVLPRPTARQRNRAAIERATAHVRGGGALLIAPQGWSRSGRRWYPGIGRIVRGLADGPGERPVLLVAYNEEGTSDRLVRRLLENAQRDSGRSEVAPDRVPRIRFSEPMPLSAFSPNEGTVDDLVTRLRLGYEAFFASSPRRAGGQRSPRRDR
ncbi:hypothetical protein H5T54_06170 [Candidatus Bipolaricaulota bacterium]|nr:hypothetical protein [Candidatus Bipolaricaulota bacterium]